MTIPHLSDKQYLDKEEEEYYLRVLNWRKKLYETKTKYDWLNSLKIDPEVEKDVKKQEHLDLWLYSKYCNKSKLYTDQQLADLDREQLKKVWRNAPNYQVTFYKNCGHTTDKDTGLYHYEMNCVVWQTPVNWVCESYGCHNLTKLVVNIFGSYHYTPICLEHWNELKRIFLDKPKEYW